MATNRQRRSDGGHRDRRGFASMDPQKQRQIAKKGGEASARMQRRDEQGQFAGNSGGSSTSASSATSSSTSPRSSSGRQAGGQRGRSGDSNR
jgi:uncharacterized protein